MDAIVNLDPPKKDVHVQLGAREMQVHLLREALLRYGVHGDYCRFGTSALARCTCGLREALTVGADLATIADVLRHPEVK